jgi:hypothetical protein
MLNCVDAVAIAMLSSSAWWSGLVWAVGAQMKNVENIQIQGEKQRAIYLEKNEKWFFRSLPFRYSNGQNTYVPLHTIKQDIEEGIVLLFIYSSSPSYLFFFNFCCSA